MSHLLPLIEAHVNGLDKLKNLANEIKQDDILKIVYDVALKRFNAPSNIKSEAGILAHETDSFWSSEIDQIRPAIKKYASGNLELEFLLDSVYSAIIDVLENMHDYFSNPMNFSPGYKVPKLGRIGDPSEGEMLTALRSIPQFKEIYAILEKRAREKKNRLKKINVANLEKDTALFDEIASIIDREWDNAFSSKILKDIAKNPKNYDFPAGTAPKNEEELIALLVKDKPKGWTKLDAIIEWVLAGQPYTGAIARMQPIHNNRKLLNMIVARSKKLKNV